MISLFRTLLSLARATARYSRKFFANLRTAFSATATSETMESCDRLSRILARSSHAAVRAGNLIGVKTMIGGKTFTAIAEISPFLEDRLRADPDLLTAPDSLYALLTSTGTSPP